MVVTLGQQYNVGEKPTVILYNWADLVTTQLLCDIVESESSEIYIYIYIIYIYIIVEVFVY